MRVLRYKGLVRFIYTDYNDTINAIDILIQKGKEILSFLLILTQVRHSVTCFFF